MIKKTKHLTIRLTEEQFKKLAGVKINEQRTKSSLIRDLLAITWMVTRLDLTNIIKRIALKPYNQLMKKYEEDFFREMDEIVSSMSEEDQKKMAFAEHFLNKLQVFDMEGIKIQLEPIDFKLFQYFILSVAMSWEMYRKPGN